MKRILKCEKCKSYTLDETCPKCGAKALVIHPAKYSPEDKHGKYRRKAKSSFYKEHDLI